MLGPGNTLAHITQSRWCGLDAALECVVIGFGCTKTFENEGLRMVTRGMQELIAQRNRKKYENLQLCIKGCVSATKTSITRTQLKRHDANPKDASSDMLYYSLGDSQPSHCPLYVPHGRIKSIAPGASTWTCTSRDMTSINDPRSQCRVSHT